MSTAPPRGRQAGPCLRPPDPHTAKSDRAIRGGLWYSLHRWASLPLWILLFFVCVTGTLATVSHEITWLINPDVRAGQGDTAAHVGYDRIAGAVTDRWPQAAIHSIQENEPYLASRVSVSLPEGGHATVYVNPYSGEIQGLSRGVTFPDFMRALHGWLLVPWHNGRSWGYYLVGLLALPLLFSLITALVVDKRFWRSFYRPYIRTRLTRRIFWSDLHRVIGTWSIWFVAVIGLTGGFYFVQGLLWDNDVVILPPAPMIEHEALPVVEGGAPEQVGIDTAVARARDAIPGLDLRWISLPESGYHHTEVYGQAGFPLQSDFSVAAFINPYTGELGGSRDVGDMTALMWLEGLTDPLHFGDFAGLFSKLIWFIFGAMLSLMIFSGMLVWHKRTAPVKDRAYRRRRPGRRDGMSMRWSRFKYHVNAALLFLPLYFLVTTLTTGTEAEGSATLLAPKSVGPWQVAPKAAGHWPPRPGQELDMTVRFDAGPVAQIRTAVLTIGDQAPAVADLLSPAAGLLHGGEVLREAHVPIPAEMPANATLWLTVERWDGSLHHVSWSLDAA